MQKISPFLWFDRNAEEAVEFYLSVFPEGNKTRVVRVPENMPAHVGKAGDALTVEFELFGQNFVALNGGPHFKFTEAVSFVVHCDAQEEVDRYWSLLTADGGEPVQCGWLKDKFGLSWQIVPKVMFTYLAGDDAEGTQRAFAAMMEMIKLDIATLERAYAGK